MDSNYVSIKPSELDGNVFELIGDKWMLITAAKKESGEINTMTASWGGLGIMWGKPIAICVIRPVRYTYEFIEDADYFTLTFYSEKYRDVLNVFGTKSGRDIDKAEEAKKYGLTLAAMNINTDIHRPQNPVYFFEPFENMLVCKKIYCQDIDPAKFIDKDIDKNYPDRDYHRMYIGEIIHAFVV